MTYLDRIRASAEAQKKATPGPWVNDGGCLCFFQKFRDQGHRLISLFRRGNKEDLRFICVARSLPLDAIVRLVEAELWFEEVRQVLNEDGEVSYDAVTAAGWHEVALLEDAAWTERCQALSALESEVPNAD
jgi:hypothetical protein